MRTFGAIVMVVGMAMGGALWAAEATTKPASTAPATPACCGDACKKMGNCCSTDAKGTTTCAMGGDCCVKPK